MTAEDQSFVVRLPALPDYRVSRAQIPGVLCEIQRLDLADIESVTAHVHDHGLGLLHAIATHFDQELRYDTGRPAPFFQQYLEEQLFDQPAISQKKSLQSIWPEVESTNLAHRHGVSVHELTKHLESATSVGAIIPNVSLNFAGPAATIRYAVLGTRDRLQPYLRARLEGTLALSADGPGLSRCDQCNRFFVQARRGQRYSRFCPGYTCADDHKRTQYETSDYRREYKRRQLALHRLRDRPGATETAVKRAEREFEAWKTAARQEQGSDQR